MTLINNMWEVSEQEKCEHVAVRRSNVDLINGIVHFVLMCKKCKLIKEEWSEEYDENSYYR